MPAIQLMTVSNKETTVPAEKTDARQTKLQGIQAAFSNYMQQTSSNGAQAAMQQNTMAAETAKPQAGGSVQQQYEQYQSKSAAQADKVSSSDTAKPVDANAAAEEAAGKVKEIIEENLGVDEEQIAQAMELLGLMQTDLLNPQQLTALVAQLTGSEDAKMMLFNENFQNILQEVSAVTEELLQNLGMTMDELMDQLAQMSAPQTDMVQQQMPEELLQAEEAPADDLQGAFVQDFEQTEDVEDTKAVSAQPQLLNQAQNAQEQPQEAVQAKEQPQETRQPQEVQQEQDTEEGQETYQGAENADTDALDKNAQENPRFDFNANVHHEANVHAPAAQDVTNQPQMPQINVQDVIEQIVEYTRTNLTEHVKTIEMQLNPEHLGKVYLHVTEQHGTITAQITAQNESLKEALVQQAAVLKDNLNQQGVKVEAVEVSVGTHEFESNLEKDARQQEEQARRQEEQNQRRSRRGINLNELDDLDGLSGLMSEEEALAAQIMRDNGNNVDYKA